MDQSMACERQGQAVSDYVVGISVLEAALPHIVVFESPCGEGMSFSGPYDNGVEAMVAAEREAALEGCTYQDGPAPFRVAPLYPPLDATETGS